MKKFLQYCISMIIAPIKTAHKLDKDPKKLYYGTIALILIEVLYTLTNIGYYFGKMPFWYPKFLDIPGGDEGFLLWTIFVSVPVTLICMCASIGIILSLGFVCNKNNKKPFSEMFPLFMFAMSYPFFFEWIFDNTIFIASMIGGFQEWFKMFNYIYTAIFLSYGSFIFILFTKITQEIKWIQATIIGFISSIVFYVLMFVFVF